MEERSYKYVCPHCGFTCLSRAVLEIHLRRKHEIKEKTDLKVDKYGVVKEERKASLNALTIFRGMTVHLTTTDGREYIGVLTSIGKNTITLSKTHLKKNCELSKIGRLKIKKEMVSHIGFYDEKIRLEEVKESFLHKIASLIKGIFRFRS